MMTKKELFKKLNNKKEELKNFNEGVNDTPLSLNPQIKEVDKLIDYLDETN